jgi:hypothetical protein
LNKNIDYLPWKSIWNLSSALYNGIGIAWCIKQLSDIKKVLEEYHVVHEELSTRILSIKYWI